MKLPTGITFEQALLGSGNGTTARGLENGQPVIVKSPDTSRDIFSDELFEDDGPQESAEYKQFESEKKREQEVAEKSQYFVKGRLEQEDGSIFWIRPYMKRSLHEKVAFKETPSSEELVNICEAIAKALAELSRIDQSGHGNLSLGNVLIPDKDISDLKLVDLFTADEGHGRADKRALGLIIYQLVNGEFVGLDDEIAAVPDHQDWKVLGTTEQMWREFCSELLNPYGKYAESDWDQIGQALIGIKSAYQKRKKLKATLIISLFLVFGAGIFLIWKLKFQEEEVVVDLDTIQGQWLELLDNYFSWGGNYLKSKSDFEKAADAKEFMDRFYDNKKARLPMKIIGRVTGQGARMQTAPDQVYEDARKIDVLLLDNSKQQQIVIAHTFLMGLRSEIGNWEVLQELSEANKAFIDSGFKFGADETQRLINSISFDDGSLSLSLLYALKTSSEGLGELQDLYTLFKVQVAALNEQTESAFLPEYATALTRQLAKPAEDPVSHLRSLVETSAELLNYWDEEKSRIAKDLFAESERELIIRPGFAISDRSLKEWKDLVKGFRLIEVPLLDSGREEFLGSKENIQQLNEQINELQEPELAPATFDQQLEQLFEKFQNDVDMPLIQANQKIIEAAVSKNLSDLKSLLVKTEDRWAEVNPDIGERLEQLAQVPDDMSAALSLAWQAYLDSEVNVRTEESFTGPREFIIFQRGYFAKLKNFEYFQDKQLSQLSADWPDGVTDDIRQDLVPALQETRRAYYDQLVSVWVDQIVPILMNTEAKLPIEAPTGGFLQRMEDYTVQLLDYVQLLNQTLNEFDSWELPEEGITSRWNALNEEDLMQEWGQSAEFAPYSNQIKIYFDLNQESEAEALLVFISDNKSLPFACSLALDKIVESGVLSPTALGQVAEIAPEVSKQVPVTKVEGFEATLKSLWTKAFEQDALDRDSREVVFSYREMMSVRAADLFGRTRFIFEIYAALAELQANEELYLEDPFLLEEFITTFATLPDDSSEPELPEILSALDEVDLTKVKETFENAPFIAKGWKIEGETEEQLILTWQNYKLVFHLVEDGERDFFLAELESSIGLFNDWMTTNKLWEESTDSLPREWEVFVSQAYSAIDDYRRGMKLWSIARRGLKRDGITTSSKWFEVDTVVADEYDRIEAEVFPVSALDKTLPMQHIGAQLALFFAESMGMSLPTPDQWKLIVKGYSGDDAFFWRSRFNRSLSSELVNEVQSGSYYYERKIEESGYGSEQPIILSRVDEHSDGNFKHLAGNIAEYLYDPEANTYYVAGGSAFSATSETWKDEHLVPKRNESTAFSDVGVRLALIAPEQSAYIQFVNIIETALEQN